jgi:hypothetical protein
VSRVVDMAMLWEGAFGKLENPRIIVGFWYRWSLSREFDPCFFSTVA